MLLLLLERIGSTKIWPAVAFVLLPWKQRTQLFNLTNVIILIVCKVSVYE